MSFNNTAFNNTTVGPNSGNGNRHVDARTQLLQQADALLHQAPNPQGVQGLAPASGIATGAA
jgi:hypothetical protein